jgi:hypothetical protein
MMPFKAGGLVSTAAVNSAAECLSVGAGLGHVVLSELWVPITNLP